MPGGRVVVGDHKSGVFGSPYRDRSLTKRDPRAGKLPGGDHQLVRGAAPLHLRRPSVPRRRAYPPWRGDEATALGPGEEVPADDPDHCEHEDPQQNEKPEPGDS